MTLCNSLLLILMFLILASKPAFSTVLTCEEIETNGHYVYAKSFHRNGEPIDCELFHEQRFIEEDLARLIGYEEYEDSLRSSMDLAIELMNEEIESETEYEYGITSTIDEEPLFEDGWWF